MVSRQAMSSDDGNESFSPIAMILNPSPSMAKWFFGLGAWGLVLALLNIIGKVHPTQHVSWGGIFTLEMTNKAFEAKADGIQFVASDAVFILMCGALVGLALKTFAEQEGGIAAFFQSLFVNDVWTSLANTENGGLNRTLGAWCLLLGFTYYIYNGIVSTGWIDPGIYSVAVALIAFGFALNYASNAPEGDATVE